MKFSKAMDLVFEGKACEALSGMNKLIRMTVERDDLTFWTRGNEASEWVRIDRDEQVVTRSDQEHQWIVVYNSMQVPRKKCLVTFRSGATMTYENASIRELMKVRPADNVQTILELDKDNRARPIWMDGEGYVGEDKGGEEL